MENINSKLELVRTNKEGYFQSMRTAEVTLYVTISRIIKTRWQKPIPMVKSVTYELRQMFNAKFYKQTQFS